MDTKGERCATHGLALAPDGSCVLCQRTSVPPRRGQLKSRRSAWRVATFVVLAMFGIIALRELVTRQGPSARRLDQPTADDEAAPTGRSARSPDAALDGTLSTKNRSDRSGSFFIPDGSPLPLLVAFHGSGDRGAGILAAFKESARGRKFAIVAPDSGFVAEAGTFTWYVARERSDASPDSEHIDRCIEEVLSLARGRIAPTGWLAVGHSGGASSAPYLATHDLRFMALHGGAFPAAFGPLRPRGWFSTGRADPARPPAHVAEQADQAARVLGTSLVQYHVFEGGHELSASEIDGVLGIWLGSNGRLVERPPISKAP
jgi:phospholipase/carboxylesterase